MNLRPLLIIPPLALALIGFRWMNQTPEVVPTVPEEARLAVRVQQIEPRPVTVTAVGYGRAEPVRDWSAIAEVNGRVTELAEGLAVGQIVEAGAVLVRIDRTDYELERRKVEANIAAVEAQLAELAREEENSRATLEVEERILEVAQAEYDRVASLVGRGTSTQATLDTNQKTLLAQDSAVTRLRNTLALYPAQRQSLEATLDARKADLAEAERALEKTTLTAPFRGRVSEFEVEIGQFVRTGDRLLALDDISAVEITAELQPSSFAPVILTSLGEDIDTETPVDISRAVDMLVGAGVTAEVRSTFAGMDAAWPAEIVRLRGTTDSETGTLGLVVRVTDPLQGRRALNRPPLTVGSFVSVHFSTPPIEGALTVPRSALHYGDDGTPFVYLADADNRLRIAQVDAVQVIGDQVSVLGGLDGSETLVLSDPRPPIVGMALDPIPVGQDQ